VETPYPPTIVEEKLARRNELKARDLETLSMDDLYNNLKIYEAEVMGSSSITQNTQNSNSSQLDNEDFKQIDPDDLKEMDLKEMDLKWQMIMLTMRAKRFLQKIGRNLDVKRTNTIGFDKTKVESYNFQRRGHFAKKCRATKHQDNRNMEASRRTVPVKGTTSNALVSQCDRLGYDWSDQAEDGPTNFALMDFTSSSSSSSYTKVSTCSKDYLKSYETLKEHYDILKKDFNKSQFNLDSQQSDQPKTGLGYDSQGIDSTVLENQENDKTSEGYHTVPPPYTGNFMSFKPDLVLAGEHVVSNEDEDEIETESNQIKPSFAKRPTGNVIDHISKDSGSYMLKRFNYVDLQGRLKHMTRNKSFLTDYQEFNRGYVAVGGSPKGGKIYGKGKIRTGKLDFEDVFFVKELKFNLLSVSQMCDKKNIVLFTEIECLILSPDFKLLDEI
nr:ribonuclease H-like domain-containing protein [Tanacetum cinerariifolium]